MTSRMRLALRSWSAPLGLYVLPVALGAIAYWVNLKVEPQLLLPAAALLTATLMGLVTITFNRLKDAATLKRPEVGVDPLRRSYLAFRMAAQSAVLALTLSGACLVTIYLGSRFEVAVRIGSAVILAGAVHLGYRLLGVISAVRAEAETLVGDRVVPPAPTEKPRLVS